MTIGITGHANIEAAFLKCYFPYVYNMELYEKIFHNFRDFLISKRDIYGKKLICCTGMARGIDEIFADAAMELNIPLILCVPNSVEWHSSLPDHKNFGRAQALRYMEKVNYAFKIHIIKHDQMSEVFNLRNSKLVDCSDEIYSYHLFDSIGTMDCINKSKNVDKYMGNLYNVMI